ncbi:MAG: hypothetical protein M0019_04375 [Actinomycetota bacterium]|nr:hypothetical protein [Actinomycetota bacterium]
MSSHVNLGKGRLHGFLQVIRRYLSILLAGLTFTGVLSSCGISTSKTPPSSVVKVTAWMSGKPVLVFGSSAEGPRFLNILRSAGYVGYMGSTSDLSHYKSLVVLSDSALDVNQVDQVKSWLQSGGSLALLSPALDSTFGLRLSKQATSVTSVTDPNLGTPVNFQGSLDSFGNLTNASLVATATYASKKVAIAIQESYHSGKLLATSFDPFANGKNGFEILPSLGSTVGKFLDAPRGPQSLQTTLYLDPGVLPANLKYNFAQIASDLVGVRSVELAAWDFGFTDPAADYPYQQLINALHDRGILVYAWFEPPFVNDYMWQKYPNCREVNEAGKAAIGDWRELIALEDPTCFSLAWSQFASVLSSFPWDGVNFAEMYFESMAHPKTATPFSPTALAQFGGDPLLNQAAFETFREKLVAQIDGELLAKVNTLPNASSLDKELTVIDDTLDPTEAKNIGSNMTLLAQVANNNGAQLQVEDPYTVWSKGPNRYIAVNSRVKSLVSPANYSIDINVINRGASTKPTAYPTMGELNLAAMEAGMVNSKVDFYALGTISSIDLKNLSYAVAGSVVDTPTGVVANFPVKVSVPATFSRLTVDGTPWPTANGVGVIPGGTHRLVWSSGSALSPGLLSIDANLGNARILAPNKIFFDYFSRSTVYALLSALPKSISASAASIPVSATPDPNGGFWVKLPAGRVSIIATF